MMFAQFIRNFHTGRYLWYAETSLLAKLRKQTGYTVSNCKKALEMHNNDLVLAEKWLNEQAQALGWSKATKLAGRATTQGLIALRFDAHNAALVELNCETDFVAKNEKFQNMAKETVGACFKFINSAVHTNGPITKISLDAERLGNLQTNHGKTLSELLVLMIGSVGENASLRRAECWKTTSDVLITGFTHPSTNETSDVTLGKYGGLLAYTNKNESNDATIVSKQICQHIVGMNPTKIGKFDDDKPNKSADDEECLIYQEYLLNPNLTVNDVIKENEIEVLDFVRFECGEDLEAKKEKAEKDAGQPLDSVQTCQ